LAPITNTFAVFVDLLTLNLDDANHHFAKTVNVVHQSHYGSCMRADQCNEIAAGPVISITMSRPLCNGFILTELTRNVSHVGAKQCGTIGRPIKVCVMVLVCHSICGLNEGGTLELWKLENWVAVRPDYNKMLGKVFQFLFRTFVASCAVGLQGVLVAPCFIYAQTTMHFSEMR
jgi:hypothetical protein